MKSFFLALFTVLCLIYSYSQDGVDHKITAKLSTTRVKLNIGQQYKAQVDDIFQVFGNGTVVHPATGKLVERDHAYLGKIKVIEVRELSAIAEIIESKSPMAQGNKLVKVASTETPVIHTKRPVQTEFQNPRQRNYSETIYTQKDNVPANNKQVHILEKRDTLGLIQVLVLDKGEQDGLKKRRKYQVYAPEFSYSMIDSSRIESGQVKLGNLRVTEVQERQSLVAYMPRKNTQLNGSFYRLRRTSYFEFDLAIEGAFLGDFGVLVLAPKLGVNHYLTPWLFGGLDLSLPFWVDVDRYYTI